MTDASFATAAQLRGIEDRRRRLGMTPMALWIGYFAVGGNGTLGDVTSWLSGSVRPSVRDYDFLAQAMNDAFPAQGLDHPLPYSTE
ncbi:MAG: hypothetical protein M3326_05300 [Actinomycetota bacterium]|nr:hypothetical protein [Actinomycetota bacterium]